MSSDKPEIDVVAKSGSSYTSDCDCVSSDALYRTVCYGHGNGYVVLPSVIQLR